MNLHTPEPLEARIAPATFTVSVTADSGAGSLRQAILDANASPDADDSILFDFTADTVISPLSALPSIGTGIAVSGLIAVPPNGVPHVVIDGSLAGAGASGLAISGDASRIEHLAIVKFSGHGIVINGSGNSLQFNTIGTDRTLAAGLGNGGDGVQIESGSGNLIGPPLGVLGGQPNIIVGNGGAGVHLAFGSSATTVAGNRIGIAFTDVALPNLNGVLIDGVSSANIVEGNVISSNTDYGIKVNSTAAGNTSAPSQFIRGNFIGTGNGGLGDFGNGKSGIYILSAHGVRVGGTGVLSGTGASEGNIISGNGTYGVEINSGDRHQLYGNWIGIDSTGSATVANNLSGVYVNGSTLNLIGSTSGHNVISGNGLHGVNLLAGGSSNSVLGNYIGTDSTGMVALGNTGDGIRIQSVLSTTIGGGGTNAGNVISGNGGDGVFVMGGTSVTGTTMKQNFIGTTAAGTGDLGNGGNGVQFASVLGTASIGGSGVGNVIAGNGLSGILVGSADLLTIQGNTIGLSGSANARGILINTGSGTTVGGFSAGQGNNIGFNTGAGVAVADAANATIRGNSIHDNGGLGIDLGNNGPTGNDPDDSDLGANGLLNHPNISSVVVTGTNAVVSGTYTGLVDTALSLDFYSNSVNGEAETYLGSMSVNTGPTGSVPFSQTFASIPAGRTISATATKTLSPGQTSEISPAVAQSPALTISDLTAAEGASGTTNFTFTLTLGAAAASNVTVDFSTADDSANAGSDYIAASGTVTFTPGQTSRTVTVSVNGDTSTESTETFFVNLSNAVGAVLTDAQAIGTITNDDSQLLTISDASIAEGNSGTTNLIFTVSLSSASASDVTVEFATANVTATAGSDFVATTGTLTFAAGELTKTITVPLLGDTTIEQTETLLLNLSNAIGATISDSQAVGTITNDDFPTLSISDVSALEASGSFTFTVTMSEPVSFPVSVSYNTLNGTALVGVDFVAASGSLTFAAGATSATIVVQITDENLVETGETFSVQLTNPVAAIIADATALATILNDDTTTLNVIGTSLDEGDAGTSDAVFTVTLTAPSASDITFDFTTFDGTATAGSDYTATSGSRTIPAGATTFEITVPVLGDALLSFNETFTVVLTNVAGAETNNLSAGAVILNDEDAVTLSVSDASVREAAGGADMVFTVALSGGLERSFSASFGTSEGTALSPMFDGDFRQTMGNFTIPAGDTSAQFTVQVYNDFAYEPDETFTVTVSNFGPLVGGLPQTATGTILDNDYVFDIAGGTVTEGGDYSFTVTRTGATDTTVLVNYQTRSGTATAGADFSSQSGTITFAPGDTEFTLTFATSQDSIVEGSELFYVDIPEDGVAFPDPIRTGTAEITILDNDAPTISLISGNPLMNLEDGADDAGRLPFVVFLSEASTVPVTVRIKTAQGSASAADFLEIDEIITFAPGSTVFESEVVITADRFAEVDETFTLSLSQSTNAVLGSDATLDFTIRDNDGLAISKNKKTATWRDLDGDLVTLKVTKPVLSPGMFTFRYGTPIGTEQEISGQLLESFDLTSAFFTAEKTGISIKAKRKDGLGDGLVNVGKIDATGMNLSAVSVLGDLGRINAGHQISGTGIKSLTLHSFGDLGTTTQSAGGNLVSTIKGNLGKLKVTGNVSDAALRIAGSLIADGNVGSVSIGGSLRGGDGDGIFANGRIGKISIAHDILGTTPLDTVSITAAGKRLPTASTMVAIAGLTVGGLVANAEILAGYTIDGTALNPTASIGAVKVKQTWTAATLAAGIARGNDGLFATSDDKGISVITSSLVSRIASITIGGEVNGTASAGDHFGFIANAIGSVKINGSKLPLANQLLDAIEVGTSGDVTVREVSPERPPIRADHLIR